ncbi:hypothetical protein FXO38_07948 [Capsicum annuum]|nr:hypothetical protein FXO38_07948 [Capsicum annuum]KAF3670791.1 hypothetical protein FXO37_08349 [Capsicum annuum]
MGSVSNESGPSEVKIAVKNNDEPVQKTENSSAGKKPEEEIPPLDVKDYEELGLIIDLDAMGGAFYENANIDFNAMFSDFDLMFPEDETKAMEINLPHVDEKDILDPPPVDFPITNPALMELQKWMDIDPPEFKSNGAGVPSLSGDPKSWDFELMERLWYPNNYQEYLRICNQGK